MLEANARLTSNLFIRWPRLSPVADPALCPNRSSLPGRFALFGLAIFMLLAKATSQPPE